MSTDVSQAAYQLPEVTVSICRHRPTSARACPCPRGPALQPRGWPGGRASPPAGSCRTGLSSELALPGGDKQLLPSAPGPGVAPWSLLMSPGSGGRVGAERGQRPQAEGRRLRPLGARGRCSLWVGGRLSTCQGGGAGDAPAFIRGSPRPAAQGWGGRAQGRGGRVWLQRSDVPGSGQGWRGGPRGQSPRGPTCLRSGVSLRPAHPQSEACGPRPSRTSLMGRRARRGLCPGGPRGRGRQATGLNGLGLAT